jgi:hypothetical protein
VLGILEITGGLETAREGSGKTDSRCLPWVPPPGSTTAGVEGIPTRKLRGHATWAFGSWGEAILVGGPLLVRCSSRDLQEPSQGACKSSQRKWLQGEGRWRPDAGTDTWHTSPRGAHTPDLSTSARNTEIHKYMHKHTCTIEGVPHRGGTHLGLQNTHMQMPSYANELTYTQICMQMCFAKPFTGKHTQNPKHKGRLQSTHLGPQQTFQHELDTNTHTHAHLPQLQPCRLTHRSTDT